MPNVDKSEDLNKLLTSKLKHIVASTLQIFKRIYTVSKSTLCNLSVTKMNFQDN